MKKEDAFGGKTVAGKLWRGGRGVVCHVTGRMDGSLSLYIYLFIYTAIKIKIEMDLLKYHMAL